ncbi:MAG: PQQ-binding-like beta-propeller repeat protein [Planctomycetales bacterium]|nr:PQQ-binding-like beta-propeller repeat protein [Planctomycetales bacterium]
MMAAAFNRIWRTASVCRVSNLFVAAICCASVVQSEVVYRVPLSEAGQSGVCLQGDRLFLTVHARLDGPLKDGFYYNGDIVGQCFDRSTGKLLWQVELPGTWAGRVLESWHDSTSLLPVADDKHVVFHNLNGLLACYTHAGKLVWKRNWQAPDPDIKNCRMFLYNGQLLTALPSKKIAVEASEEHPALPFYQLHSINLESGEDNWISPILITHATQYSLDNYNGEPVIVASMIDLSHWTFHSGRWGYLLSVRDGSPIQTFNLPPTIPHQKNQLCRGHFLVTAPAGRNTKFQLIDPETSSITNEFSFEKPDEYFAWSDSRYVQTEFQPEYTDRTLKGNGQPTPSTVHVVADRIYFWRYDSGDIGCIDVETGKSVLVEVPIQVLPERTVWNKVDFSFTDGIRNFEDRVVNTRVGSVRGIERGGFGHTNPAWPIFHQNKLYWQGGAGVLYIIDTSQPFSPQAISWQSIETVAQSWTFGEPAIDEAHIYIRSQRELVKLRQ